MKKIIVLLAGGEGKRFKSSVGTETPKQFYRETPTSSNMLEKSLARLASLKVMHNMDIIVATKQKYMAEVQKSKLLSGINFIIEADECANTGPAIFNVLNNLVHQHGDSVLGFFPVDHEYSNDQLFTDKILRLFRIATQIPGIFLLGSKVTSFDDQKGYINPKGQAFGDANTGLEILKVASFLEKPSAEELATKELLIEHLLVNMGIFIGRASNFLRCYLGAAIACRGERFVGESFDKEILSKFQGNLYVATANEFVWKDVGVAAAKKKSVSESAL
jgi:mannose-1-phosphate guanylyltransferase